MARINNPSENDNVIDPQGYKFNRNDPLHVNEGLRRHWDADKENFSADNVVDIDRIRTFPRWAELSTKERSVLAGVAALAVGISVLAMGNTTAGEGGSKVFNRVKEVVIGPSEKQNDTTSLPSGHQVKIMTPRSKTSSAS